MYGSMCSSTAALPSVITLQLQDHFHLFKLTSSATSCPAVAKNYKADFIFIMNFSSSHQQYPTQIDS